MNAPTLFDTVAPHPRARYTDPPASYLAAHLADPGTVTLVNAIRNVLSRSDRAHTQHEIARKVEIVFPGRWQADTIRTACARADLELVETVKIAGRSYGRYQLRRES